MNTKDRLSHTLQSIRAFSEGLLKSFSASEDWFFLVHPTANHAAWIVGHVGHVDNMCLKMLRSPKYVEDTKWEGLFAPGSQPADDAGLYPSPAELVSFWQARRADVMALLEEQTDETLKNPVPPGSAPMFTDIGSVFELVGFHEAMHFGQLTVARQALKHPRLIDFPPSRTRTVGTQAAAKQTASATA